MKERPILMFAPMVRSLLACTKSQTRRIAKPKHLHFFEQSASDMLGQWGGRPLPYGQTGDRLWVRETWMDLLGTGIERMTGDRYAYAADTPPGSYGDDARKGYGLKWRPSIHMPRAASRITLEITGIRVERLQEISGADCIAEGIDVSSVPDYVFGYQEAYRDLWESINKPGSWDKNPWVWVVEFRRIEREPGPNRC